MTRRLLKTAGRLEWFRRTVGRLGRALDRLPAPRQPTDLEAPGRARDAARRSGRPSTVDALLAPPAAPQPDASDRGQP
jgi:hypothetical protein